MFTEISHHLKYLTVFLLVSLIEGIAEVNVYFLPILQIKNPEF